MWPNRWSGGEPGREPGSRGVSRVLGQWADLGSDTREDRRQYSRDVRTMRVRGACEAGPPTPGRWRVDGRSVRPATGDGGATAPRARRPAPPAPAASDPLGPCDQIGSTRSSGRLWSRTDGPRVPMNVLGAIPSQQRDASNADPCVDRGLGAIGPMWPYGNGPSAADLQRSQRYSEARQRRMVPKGTRPLRCEIAVPRAPGPIRRVRRMGFRARPRPPAPLAAAAARRRRRFFRITGLRSITRELPPSYRPHRSNGPNRADSALIAPSSRAWHRPRRSEGQSAAYRRSSTVPSVTSPRTCRASS